MGVLKKLFNGIIGAFLGGVFGFFLVLFSSWVFDKLNPPEYTTGSMISIGWVFTFFSIPFFALIGLIWFIISPPFQSKKKKI